MALAEYYHQVTRDNLRIAVHQYSFAGTNDTTYVGFVRQVESFHFVSGDQTAFFRIELYNLGIGTRQVVNTANGRIQQHLVDVTGGDGFLIEHGAYIQSFRHRDIIEVLHLGDGLAYAKTLGCQAGKDIRFAAVGNGYESIRVLDTFFFEHIHVGTVGIDNQRLGYFLTQDIAQLAVFLDNLDILAFDESRSRFSGYTVAAEEDDILYLAFGLA